MSIAAASPCSVRNLIEWRVLKLSNQPSLALKSSMPNSSASSIAFSLINEINGVDWSGDYLQKRSVYCDVLTSNLLQPHQKSFFQIPMLSSLQFCSLRSDSIISCCKSLVLSAENPLNISLGKFGITSAAFLGDFFIGLVWIFIPRLDDLQLDINRNWLTLGFWSRHRLLTNWNANKVYNKISAEWFMRMNWSFSKFGNLYDNEYKKQFKLDLRSADIRVYYIGGMIDAWDWPRRILYRVVYYIGGILYRGLYMLCYKAGQTNQLRAYTISRGILYRGYTISRVDCM